ncbi:MAG: hypothetical protein HYY91_05920 [Candidatus Omnitrophica bacterium]|nr:hypothetical protein [Candidatus Omnitrophota bacterium]
MANTVDHNSSSPQNHARAHRVIASLNREQVDVLDKIGKDALFSSGTKLSRTEILSALVNVLRRLNLTGEGIQSPAQFEQRVVDLVIKARGGKHHA